MLQDLPSLPKAEIEAIVADIENGTYKRGPVSSPEPPTPSAPPAPSEPHGGGNPTGTPPDEGPQPDTLASRISDSLYSALQKIGASPGAEDLRQTLRALIDSLEVYLASL